MIGRWNILSARYIPTIRRFIDSDKSGRSLVYCFNSSLFSRRSFNDNHAHSTHSFSHLDSTGRAQMVDVSSKSETTRSATARTRILMPPSVVAEVERQNLKKGDVLTVAQIAGISGAKKTSELIPLCHNIPLSKVDVKLSIWRGEEVDSATEASTAAPATCGIDVIATAKTEAKTGVEMEALTAALVAALTVYDMCKALTHDMVITQACLLEKSGGKAYYRRGN